MSAWLARLRELGRDSESGAATTEFVLVFPIQLFLTLMVIQFAFIVHAHLVVSQAAFMGARAAAVADGMSDGSGPAVQRAAAMREVARTLAVLSSGEAPETPATLPTELPDMRLRWPSGDGQRVGFNEDREQEAYGHLQPNGVTILDLTADPQHGYVSCEVQYDYVMFIPVANHAFARTGGFVFGGDDPYTAESQARKRTVFRVHRVGFVPTPWTLPPR